MGGLCRLFPDSHSKPAQKDPDRPGRNPSTVGAVRAGFGSKEQARASMEPRFAISAWGGAGDRPAVLLRAVDRKGRVAVPVHGRRFGGDGDGGAHGRGRGAPVPRVAAVQAGVRFEGVAGGRVREARVGRACHRVALPAIDEGVLVRRLRYSPRSSGSLLALPLPLLCLSFFDRFIFSVCVCVALFVLSSVFSRTHTAPHNHGFRSSLVSSTTCCYLGCTSLERTLL